MLATFLSGTCSGCLARERALIADGEGPVASLVLAMAKTSSPHEHFCRLKDAGLLQVRTTGTSSARLRYRSRGLVGIASYAGSSEEGTLLEDSMAEGWDSNPRPPLYRLLRKPLRGVAFGHLCELPFPRLPLPSCAYHGPNLITTRGPQQVLRPGTLRGGQLTASSVRACLGSGFDLVVRPSVVRPSTD